MAANGFDDDQTGSFTNLAAGTKVSHYKIISKIGAGGRGEVYLAEDTQLDCKVALKFLLSHLSQYDASCARRCWVAARTSSKTSAATYIMQSYLPQEVLDRQPPARVIPRSPQS